MKRIVGQHDNNVTRIESRLPGPDHFIQVPDATYTAYFLGKEAFFYRGIPNSPKVALWFRLRDRGSECRIAGYWNVLELRQNGERLHPKFLKERRLRHFEFEVGWRADLTADLARLFPDRYSPSALPTAVPAIREPVLVQTGKVRRDHRGADRPEGFRCSKVVGIVRWAND